MILSPSAYLINASLAANVDELVRAVRITPIAGVVVTGAAFPMHSTDPAGDTQRLFDVAEKLVDGDQERIKVDFDPNAVTRWVTIAEKLGIVIALLTDSPEAVRSVFISNGNQHEEIIHLC